MRRSATSLFVFGLITGSVFLAANAREQQACEVDWALAESLFRDQVPPALNSSFYRWLDPLLDCAVRDELSSTDGDRLKGELGRIAERFPTPAFVAQSPDRLIPLDGTSEILGTGISSRWRSSYGLRLSQLNSGVIAFTSSDIESTYGSFQTSHNFFYSVKASSDLAPWVISGGDGYYRSQIDQAVPGALEKPASNFSFTIGNRQLSKIGISTPVCYFYRETRTVKCERNVAATILHETLHLLPVRYPITTKTLLNLKGGYYARLSAAQHAVPEFMRSKCAPDVYENFCQKDGPVSKAEAAMIVNASNPPQIEGSLAKRYSAWPLRPEISACPDGQEQISQNALRYCVDTQRESLYAFVRHGSEYLQSLYELAISDSDQYRRVASPDEQRTFQKLQEYLYR